MERSPKDVAVSVHRRLLNDEKVKRQASTPEIGWI